MKKVLLLIAMLSAPGLHVISQTLYTNIEPDSTIAAPYVPPMADTGISMSFDINHDTIPDFRLTSDYRYEFEDPHCCDCYFNRIIAFDTNTRFAYQDTAYVNNNPHGIVGIDSGEVIDEQKFIWYFSAYLSWDCSPDHVWFCQPGSFMYYGIKLYLNGNYYYGWVRLLSNYTQITISDMALNLIPNAPIIAGSLTSGYDSNQINASQFRIYPNPVFNNLTVETSSFSTIKISAIQGQLIKTFASSGTKTNVDVSALPGGVYVVEVRNEKGVAVKKFIKE